MLQALLFLPALITIAVLLWRWRQRDDETEGGEHSLDSRIPG